MSARPSSTTDAQLWSAFDYLASQYRVLRILIELGDLEGAREHVRKWQEEYRQMERRILEQHERIRDLFDRANLDDEMEEPTP